MEVSDHIIGIMERNDELASTIPVSPPTVKRKRNPSTQSMGVSSAAGVPWRVANQEKILIPVGTAMIMVAEVK